MNRTTQVIDQLSAYYSEDEAFPNCLYLFGLKSVGKTFCLHKFLDSSRDWLCSVVVHAQECYTNKILFDTIVNSLNGHKLSKASNYVNYAKVDSIDDFLKELSSLDAGKSYLIAIENAEKLRDMEFNMLPVFWKLQEFTGLNISCVFVSHIAFEKLGAAPTTAIIQVPNYTKNDLIEIFSNNYPQVRQKINEKVECDESIDLEEKMRKRAIVQSMDEEFYRNFLNIFLNVFFKACRDIIELEFLANKCYKSYYAPVINGEIKYNDITNLWRNITKLLKVSFNTSHMRIENITDMSKKTDDDWSMMEAAPNCQSSVRAFAQTLELPYYAKYLLIASFLASHNDAKSDKRLFMKHHGKEKKRQKKAKVRTTDNLRKHSLIFIFFLF